jgi:tetratricopeptide (TPR) repeat protein
MYDKDRLDENAWALLVNYLERANRWKEVVRYLVPLVEFRPDQLHYRLRLMHAYYHNSQQDELVATLDTIDTRWHDKSWWNENTLGNVASTCHQTHLWQRAADYYEELIPLHQRSHPARGVGNGTLSSYYTTLADCHLHLENTPAAVEAASGAIVSWGSHISNRTNALETLRNVLQKSKDLDGYVQLLEDEVEETGLENPILRKALGQVYLERPDGIGKAIYHLTLAVESQPDDEQTHRSLIAAYDKKGDEEGAIARVLEAAKLNRRNIAFFKDLGLRYEKLGRAKEAERARTNIAEALPNESEGHAMLAEIRQGQGRWKEAASHWAQVAIIRELEPTGLQRLADAQIKLGENAAAAASLKKLLAKDWPSRFNNVHSEARNKLAALDKKTD